MEFKTRLKENKNMTHFRNTAEQRTNRRAILRAGSVAGRAAISGGSSYATEKGPESPLDRADFFPICVWLQSPRNAGAYKKAGFNTYVGL